MGKWTCVILPLLLCIFETSHEEKFDKRESGGEADLSSAPVFHPHCGYLLTGASGLNRLPLLWT